MAITIDGPSKRILLDSSSVSAAEIWTAWSAWHAQNAHQRRFAIAMTQEGGSLVDPVMGIYSPLYFFMENGWRIRPMEANHDLSIVGNIIVRGGGTPVVRTLGPYQVNVGYIVPERAQGIVTSGATGPTAAEIADAVWNKQMSESSLRGSFGEHISRKLLTLSKFLGLQ